MTTYFVQTNDEDRIVKVERDYVEVVDAGDGPRDFNLVNTLKASTMAEVRAAAKEAGLRLKKPSSMGVFVG